MKRKNIIVGIGISIILTSVIIFSIANSNQVSKEIDSIDANKVKIEIDKNTINSTSMSITIINNNKKQLTYGEEFKIQKKINGEWKDLDNLPNTIWNAMAYITEGNSQTNKKLDIEKHYGKLENGTYRVVKPVFDGEDKNIDIYSAEFEVEVQIVQ